MQTVTEHPIKTMDSQGKKININTIARAAKVSTTTVSNFINGTEVFPISPETRGRIKGAMRQFNYRPHIGGVLMRRSSQRCGKIGFIMGECCNAPVYHTVGIPLVQRLLCELEQTVSNRLGLSLEILRINDEDSWEEWNARLLDQECLINYGQINSMMCDTLYRRNLPLIEIYSTETVRRHGDFSGVEEEYDFLFWRNERQIAEIFRNFYQKGARKFLYLSSHNIKALRPDFYGFDAEAKLNGFLQALSAHSDCTGEVLTPPPCGDFSMFREFALIRELLKEKKDALLEADAILCHNDIVAQGAASIAMEFGRKPGQDFFLSGEGFYREFQHWHPSITTCSVDYRVLTKTICDLIELRCSGNLDNPRKIEIPTELIHP